MAGCADAIGIAVIEGEERVVARRQSGRDPGSGCVAGRAGCGPGGSYVIGIRGAGEISLVAGVAVRGRASEDIVDVALIAGDRNMRASEREGRVVVIEGSASPGSGGMAGIAGGGESCSSVIWIGCSVPICLVAAVTGGRQCCVVVVCVACGAGNRGVEAGERKRRVVVIERGGAPGRGGVADGAVGGETGSDVVGICCAREIGLMAGVAGCWS